MLSINNISYAVELINNSESDLVVLKPKMVPQPYNKPVYKIKTANMASYLDNIVLLDDEDEFTNLPYLIGFAGDTNVGSAGDTAYSSGIKADTAQTFYTVINSGGLLVNPHTQEDLGLQVYSVGDANLRSYNGKSQTLYITKSTEAIDIGSRLIPRVALDMPDILEVKLPDKPMLGYILSIKYQDTGVGKFSTVVISLGKRNGLQQGDLLYLMDVPQEITDLYTQEKNSMLERKFGEIVIYKSMEKVSLGFILEASRSVLINDKVVALAPGS